MTLVTEARTKLPDMKVLSPTVLTAQTDNDGYAMTKDSFGAGFDKWGTSIYVGSSSVRCEAPGYSTSEVRVSSPSRLRFRDLAIYKQPLEINVRVLLSR